MYVLGTPSLSGVDDETETEASEDSSDDSDTSSSSASSASPLPRFVENRANFRGNA